MAQMNATIKNVCIPANKIRENYYSDTYRAKISIKDVCQEKTCDIQLISIPFSPEKESRFMQRFDVRREDLPEFYRAFTKNILNQEQLIRELNRINNSTIQKIVLDYLAVQSVPKLNAEEKQVGVDIYLVTEQMDPFVGSENFTCDGASLKNIVSFGIRMLQTIKAFHDNGYTIGAIDLDSCCLFMEENGQRFLKTGYFLYGSGPNSKPVKYTRDVAPFIMFEDLEYNGVKQSADTDIFMLCGLLWTLLDGRHYTSGIDLSHEPRYAPPELSEILRTGVRDLSKAYKVINVGLRTYLKMLVEGEAENPYIPFDPPLYYLNPLPEMRTDLEESRLKKSEKGKDSIKDRDLPKRLWTVVLFALIIGGVGWYTIVKETGVLHERFFPAPTPVSTPVPTPTSNAVRSKTAGLYAGTGGKVLNSDGTVNLSYIIDANGDMIAPESGYRIYTREQVDDYMYFESVSVGILERTYSDQGAFGKDPILRDDVIDLRYTTYEHSEEEPFRLTQTLIDQYEMEPGTYILVNNVIPESEEPDGYTVFTVDAYESDGKTEFRANPITPIPKDLYKAQGTWRMEVQIKSEPKAPTNSRITVTSENPENLKLIATQNGLDRKVKGIKTSLDSSGSARIKLEANVEGKYSFIVRSDDGYYEKKFAVRFEAPEGAAIPTPVPTFKERPVVAPTPVPTSEPTSVPQQSYQQDYQGGAYYPPGYQMSYPQQYYEQPMLPQQSQSNQEPNYPEIPDVQTPAWVAEFSVDQTYYEIHVGETITIAPSLSCWIMSSPPGIVAYPDNVVPFRITGIAPGTCTVTLVCTYSDLKDQRIEITINVIP